MLNRSWERRGTWGVWPERRLTFLCSLLTRRLYGRLWQSSEQLAHHGTYPEITRPGAATESVKPDVPAMGNVRGFDLGAALRSVGGSVESAHMPGLVLGCLTRKSDALGRSWHSTHWAGLGAAAYLQGGALTWGSMPEGPLLVPGCMNWACRGLGGKSVRSIRSVQQRMRR